MPLIGRDGLQHIVGWILARRRTADPYFDPNKPRRAESLDHRSHPLMPTVASIGFDTESPWFQIKIIMNEDEIIRRQIQLAHKGFEGGTRDVHPIEQAG